MTFTRFPKPIPASRCINCGRTGKRWNIVLWLYDFGRVFGQYCKRCRVAIMGAHQT